MKKLVIAAILVFSFSAAAHSGDSGLPEVNEAPGTLGYSFMQIQEKVSVFLTLDPAEKAEKRVKFAQKRLAVAKNMAEHNRTEKAKEAMKQFSSQIEKARGISRDLPEQERQHIQRDINRTTSTEVLQGVLEKVPEQARQGIMTALESQGKVPEKPPAPGDRGQGQTLGNDTGDRSIDTGGFIASGRVVPAE